MSIIINKTRAMERKIDACEIWIWRRMLRVAWTEKITNKSILQEINKRKFVIVTESRKTEDDVYRAHD